jgi:hypothetical protein
MDVADAGQPDPMALIIGRGSGIAYDSRDTTGIDNNPDVARPAFRQQRFLKKQSCHF